MTSLWRIRRAAAGHPNVAELSIPAHFRCPISLELMKDPVTLTTGITYDRQSIETWLEMGNQACPVTNRQVPSPATEDLIPNHVLRRMIQDWCVAHRSHGVERIPTPRIPATPAEVRDLLSDLTSAARRGDAARCRDLAAKLKSRAKESERNRRCIVDSGAAAVLSAAFGAFAAATTPDKNRPSAGVLEELLSTLARIFPLDEESRLYLSAPASLRSLVHFLSSGDLAGRLNAVMVVKELAVFTEEVVVGAVAETGGMAEALVKLVKEPISPQTTKASLVAIFYLVSSDERTATRFVDMGLVHLLLDILVDSDKSTSEKALGVLDGLCGCPRGRAEAYGNALALPVVVKKMFRVSDLATAFAVSVAWKLCKNHEREGGVERGGCVVEEALQVGAFQKLLLLLQVGCSEGTKEKASELLKLLNASRERSECIESVDFKRLKRPF